MSLFSRSRLPAVFLALSVTAGAQTLMLPPAPLLPSHFGTYQAQAAPATGDDADGAARAIGGNDGSASTILKEDGLQHFAAGHFTRSAGAPVQVEVLEFGDATGAFSAYTALRGGESRELGKGVIAGAQVSQSGHGLVAISGTSVVLTSGAAVEPRELAPLVLGLPKVSGTRGSMPLLPTYLPEAGLKPGTIHYAVGPATYQATSGLIPDSVLAWDKSTEIASAEYSGKNGHGLLTLIFFPTPQIAGDRGRAIDAALKQLPPDQQTRLGDYRLRREGPMLILAASGFTPEQAQALVNGIHLRTELTYNKPMPLEFHAEIQKTTSLLTSIGIFCGVGAAAAVLLGLFLGGGRAAYRVLRGKSASSDPEFLSINLRGKVEPFVQPEEAPKEPVDQI